MVPSNTVNKNVLLLDQKPHITQSEYHTMQEACMREYENKARKGVRALYVRDRNCLLMELMWVTGARITDVLNFKVSDIDTYDKSIHFYVQKRDHMHKLSLESDVIIHIQNYITKWSIKDHLFSSVPGGKPLSRFTALKIIQKYGKLAGIGDNVHPHLFRHGCAVRMVESGVPLEIVSYYLDHADTKTTTQFYARITHNTAEKIIKERVGSMLG